MPNTPPDRTEIEDADGVTPPSKRRIALASVDDVRVEMARVYREARLGTLAPEIAAKLTWMLATLAKVTEVATVERRLVEIEKLLQEGRQHELASPAGKTGPR